MGHHVGYPTVVVNSKLQGLRETALDTRFSKLNAATWMVGLILHGNQISRLRCASLEMTLEKLPFSRNEMGICLSLDGRLTINRNGMCGIALHYK